MTSTRRDFLRRSALLATGLGTTPLGRAWSEPTLLKLAYAFEHAAKARRPPRYLATNP